MSDLPIDAVDERVRRIAWLAAESFCTGPLTYGVRTFLEEDAQLRRLVACAEHLQRVIVVRVDDSAGLDPLCPTLVAMRTAIEGLIDARTTEVSAEVCAAYLRDEDIGYVDEDTTVDSTLVQDLFDGLEEAETWLDDNAPLLGHLDLHDPYAPVTQPWPEER